METNISKTCSYSTKQIDVHGRSIVIQLISMGQDEGLTTQQVAYLFGVNYSAVRKSVIENNLVSLPIVTKDRQALRSVGIIPVTGRAPNFLPRNTIRALAKIFNTCEAWAVYNQLWSAVEDPQVYTAIRVEAGLNTIIPAMEDMIQRLKGEYALRLTAEKRGYTSMGKLGGLTRVKNQLEQQVVQLEQQVVQLTQSVVQKDEEIIKERRQAKIAHDEIHLIDVTIALRREREGLEVSATGFFYNKIKERFGMMRTNCTYKELSRAELDTAIHFVNALDIPEWVYEKHTKY